MLKISLRKKLLPTLLFLPLGTFAATSAPPPVAAPSVQIQFYNQSTCPITITPSMSGSLIHKTCTPTSQGLPPDQDACVNYTLSPQTTTIPAFHTQSPLVLTLNSNVSPTGGSYSGVVYVSLQGGSEQGMLFLPVTVSPTGITLLYSLAQQYPVYFYYFGVGAEAMPNINPSWMASAIYQVSPSGTAQATVVFNNSGTGGCQ